MPTVLAGQAHGGQGSEGDVLGEMACKAFKSPGDRQPDNARTGMLLLRGLTGAPKADHIDLVPGGQQRVRLPADARIARVHRVNNDGDAAHG